SRRARTHPLGLAPPWGVGLQPHARKLAARLWSMVGSRAGSRLSTASPRLFVGTSPLLGDQRHNHNNTRDRFGRAPCRAGRMDESETALDPGTFPLADLADAEGIQSNSGTTR